jgi:hypothetical protein
MEAQFNIPISLSADSSSSPSSPVTTTAIDQEKEGVLKQKLLNQLCGYPFPSSHFLSHFSPPTTLFPLFSLTGLGYLDQSIMTPVMEKLLSSSEGYNSFAKSGGSLSVLYEIGHLFSLPFLFPLCSLLSRLPRDALSSDL